MPPWKGGGDFLGTPLSAALDGIARLNGPSADDLTEQPLIEYYAQKNVLKEVDGTQDLEDVFRDITKILQ